MPAADIRRLPEREAREAAWAHKRTIAEWFRDDPAKHAEMDPDMRPAIVMDCREPMTPDERAWDRYHSERPYLSWGGNHAL